MAFGTLNVSALSAGDAVLSVTLGTSTGNDFSVGSGKLLVEGDTKLVSVGAGGDFATSTTGKVKQRGAFLQSSTHQSLFLGA